jgi:hypothetical protein
MRDVKAILECGIEDLYGVSAGDNVATLPPSYQAIKYSCPICGETYSTTLQALACRDQKYDTGGLRVGDIVVVPGAYNSGIEDDDPWLAFSIPPNLNSDSHFDRRGYKIPYYVVTAVHPEEGNEHRCLVTLCTFHGGVLNAGWNPANGDGHYAMYRWDSDEHCAVSSNWLEDIQEPLDNCEPCATLKREAAELAAHRISSTRLL